MMLSNHFILCHPLLLLSSIFSSIKVFSWCFPGGSNGKESTCKAGDPGSIPGSGRSSGEGNGYPLQYSFHTVHGVDAFELWCWRRLLRVPWTASRSNHSIPKEINPEYSLEILLLKLKFQYFDHLMRRAHLIGKDPDAGKD